MGLLTPLPLSLAISCLSVKFLLCMRMFLSVLRPAARDAAMSIATGTLIEGECFSGHFGNICNASPPFSFSSLVFGSIEWLVSYGTSVSFSGHMCFFVFVLFLI